MTTSDPARLWPWLERLASGRLELSFDAPLNEDRRADWLKVRDWLQLTAGATFHGAYEYPTFEWYASMRVPHGTTSTELRLWWADYPDELTLCSASPDGDARIEQIAASLRVGRPDLWDLRSMDRDAWRRWMASLGSPSY